MKRMFLCTLFYLLSITKIDAAQQVAKDVVVPVERIVFQQQELDQQGYPTPAALVSLMNRIHFSPASQVQVVQRDRGGTYTDRIYTVSALKGEGLNRRRENVFFLKFSAPRARAKDTAAQRLQRLQRGYIARTLVESRYGRTRIAQKDLPVMTWLERIFTYNIPDQVLQNLPVEQRQPVRTIEMSHAAHGQSLHSFLQRATNEQAEQCGYRVGLTLGSFQQLFINYHDSDNPKNWTTVSHGDLHAGNVFYDSATQRVYYIDNETMRDGYTIYIDLVMNVVYGASNQGDRYQRYKKAFFKGYLEAYRDIVRKVQLAQYLLRPNNEIFETDWLRYYQEILQRVVIAGGITAEMLTNNYSNLLVSNDDIRNDLRAIIANPQAQAVTRLQHAFRGNIGQMRLRRQSRNEKLINALELVSLLRR